MLPTAGFRTRNKKRRVCVYLTTGDHSQFETKLPKSDPETQADPELSNPPPRPPCIVLQNTLV
eukprot:5059664-Amphidinium_carterae.1